MKLNGFDGGGPGIVCPVPVEENDIVQLAHGGGGRRTASLIDSVFLPSFASPALDALGDGAVLDVGGQRLAFSTDSFVVQPIFFPGGNIGSLAVHGTVNDLAMCGAEPVALSAAFVLEEGFAMKDLRLVVAAMAAAAAEAGVPVVTGDTKVVDRGKGDGIYINTTGIGRVRDGVSVGPDRARPGDVVLVSGPVGDHGIAVMAARSGLEFHTRLVSDSASVLPLVKVLLDAVPSTRTLRDPTRGGLATALCELAISAGVGIRIDEGAVPVRHEVRAACELLGFDPLYVACEGRFLAIVPAAHADLALAALRALPAGAAASRIGEIVEGPAGRVLLRTGLGSHRRLERLSGEQLPEDLLRLAMHEYSLVQALLDRVETEARVHAATGVHRVTVRIGRMGGVEPALFATAFEMSRVGTMCEHAELELKTEDVSWVCDVCSAPIAPGHALVCDCCGWPARMTAGDALVLEHLELEVPSRV